MNIPLGINISVHNNTFGEDLTSALGWTGVSSGLVWRDNLVLCTSGHFINAPTTASNFGVVFSQADYNVYLGGANWLTDGVNTFSTFATWQNAWTATSTPCLAITGNPDPNGKLASSLSGYFNEASVCPGYLSRNYALGGSVGTQLLTASSTGGPVGANMTGIGPGWFA